MLCQCRHDELTELVKKVLELGGAEGGFRVDPPSEQLQKRAAQEMSRAGSAGDRKSKPFQVLADQIENYLTKAPEHHLSAALSDERAKGT